ncbi:MAG TPA: hypothetical protein VFQ58_05165 [Flavisolibacter sp.]|nr:hypothetical protein [Flavisolibacter sp.]
MFLFSTCYGPRNIFSSGPYISPVKLGIDESALETFYISNSTKSYCVDSTKRRQNKGVGLSLTHRFKGNNQFNYYISTQKEKLSLHDPYHILTNADFDNSFISTSRFTTGIGFTQFINRKKKFFSSATSISGMIAFQNTHINDTGDIQQNLYTRNFNINNLFLSIQFASLLHVSYRFKIGIMSRFTLAHYFSLKTNYSEDELKGTALNKVDKTQFYPSLAGLHLEYKPVKELPISIIGQLYCDWSYWHLFSQRSKRTYINGTGLSLGLKYQVKFHKYN